MDQVSIGRIVHYYLSADETVPAIITEVVSTESGIVNLTIFKTGSENYALHAHPATENETKSGRWVWPPRVG